MSTVLKNVNSCAIDVFGTVDIFCTVDILLQYKYTIDDFVAIFGKCHKGLYTF